MLRYLQNLPLVVVLMGISGLASFLPGLHAFAIRDYAIGRAFFYAGAITLFVTVMLAIVTGARSPRLRLRGPLIALLVSYLTLPFWLALPLVFAVPGTALTAGWFEMVSAFTTTGATLWPSGAGLPPAVHVWRAIVGWGGGAFILIVAAAILAPVNLGGREIVTGAAIGKVGERGAIGKGMIEPGRRFFTAAALVLPAYGGLTAVLWSGLIISGSTAAEGLCLAMSTLSTSGITCGQTVAENAAGLWGEVLIFGFLGLALSRRLLPGPAITDRQVPLWRDPELRLAGIVLLLLPVLLVGRHWFGAFTVVGENQAMAALNALWGAVFSTLSFLTTTGFVSADWDIARAWSGMTTPGLVFLGLAIFGGGVATTAGGVKLLRIYALARHGQRELERIVHPSSVGGEGLAARRLRREGAFFAWVFFMLFAMSLAVLMLGLSLTGLQFDSTLILTIAAITTTGPLIEVAGQAPIVLDPANSIIQIILAFGMILGRIEILALVAVFTLGEQRR